jgi:hypothetical protein
MKILFGCFAAACALSASCGSSSNPAEPDPSETTETDSGSVRGKDSGTHSTTANDAGSARADSGSRNDPEPVVDASGSAAHDAGGAQGSDASVSHDAASGAHDAAVAITGTQLTGTLGALGAVVPTVSSWVISNSGETLIYMTSAPLTCEQLKVSRWLGTFTAGAQVVEIVVSGKAPVGMAVRPEVNFAAGGKSSAYETTAATSSVTFTKSEPMGVIEGTVSATYRPSGDVMGTFHAEFCAGGQGY